MPPIPPAVDSAPKNAVCAVPTATDSEAGQLLYSDE